jgi:hypothetical protein
MDLFVLDCPLSPCCYGNPRALKTTTNEIQVPLELLKDRRGALPAGLEFTKCQNITSGFPSPNNLYPHLLCLTEIQLNKLI